MSDIVESLPRRIAAVAGLALAAGMVAVLFLHTLVGPHLRLVADDFCVSRNAQDGLLEALELWYFKWIGRYSSMFAWTLVVVAPSVVLRSLPALVLGAWIAIGQWTLEQGAKALELRRGRLCALLLNVSLVSAMVEMAPNVPQSLYWIGGSANYVVPLILLTAFAGIVLRAYRVSPSGWRLLAWMGLAAVLIFFAGGTGENYIAFQVTFLAMALAAARVWLPGHAAVTSLLAMAFATAALGMGIVFFAPGNAVRLAKETPEPMPLPEVFAHSLDHARHTAIDHADPRNLERFPAIVTLFGVGAGIALLAMAPSRRGRPGWSARRLALVAAGIGVLTLVLMWSSTVPAYFGTAKPPPQRARVVTLFPFLVGVAWAGFVVGSWARERDRIGLVTGPLRWGLPVLAAALLFVGPLQSGHVTFERAKAFRVFAEDWDARDAAIRRARAEGIRHVALAPLRVSERELFDLGTLADNPQHWINRCAAGHYGVDSIVVPLVPHDLDE